MYARTACCLLAAWACVGCSLALSFDGITGGVGPDGSSGDANFGGDAALDGGHDVQAEGGAEFIDATEDVVGDDQSVGADSGPDRFVDDAPTGGDTGQTQDTGAIQDSGPIEDTGPLQEAGDGGSLPFCASLSPAPRFCDDFDEHPLPGVWDTLTQTGGTLTLDTTTSVSPPKSLLARDMALAAGQPLDSSLRMHVSLPPPPTTFVWDFQVQPVAVDTSASAAMVFVSIDFTDATNDRYSVQFTMYQNGGPLGVRMEEQSGFADGGSSYVAHPLPDPLPIGQWTDVRLVLTRTAAMSASARVTFGNAVEMDKPIGMTVNGSVLQMTVGSSYETEPSQGWTTRYDNVTLNF